MRTLIFALATASLAMSSAAFGATFELSSPSYRPGDKIKTEQVYNGLDCVGGNLSPALTWKNPPAGTRSFLLTFFDPDAPSGSGWWQWVVYNIPATATGLPEGVTSNYGLPAGAAEGRTDYGNPGYGGPCTPPGPAHRYIFTLTALKVSALDVPTNATAAWVGYVAHGEALATAQLVLQYSR
ncbi:YbhB/YbcL family Raf kinase inhibitor-like protein [Bradyrhizobium canariense]|uniref:Phospholipid-binding protein, PBP family n=1 Tax=Bradyrhizobium canariense TaxID=255045 RepID=A0A1H2AGV5_9BRAD|nr:YbhB/YbcL family Raf kinase inhibitor-like protein [Bradyrhizobium canariense]SDT45218.1 phospholipid-binding protein, PBP family [Bradyrhizobium canariense]